MPLFLFCAMFCDRSTKSRGFSGDSTTPSPPCLSEGLGSLHQSSCLINLASSPSINEQVPPSAQRASGSRVRSIGDALAKPLPPGVSRRSVTAPMVGLPLIGGADPGHLGPAQP